MEATDKLKHCPICLQTYENCRHFEIKKWHNLKFEYQLFLHHLKAFFAMISTPAFVAEPAPICCASPAPHQHYHPSELEKWIAESQSESSVHTRRCQERSAEHKLRTNNQTHHMGLSSGLGMFILRSLQAWIPTNHLPTHTHTVSQNERNPLPEPSIEPDLTPITMPTLEPIPEATPLANAQWIPEATPVAEHTAQPAPAPTLMARPVIDAEALPICSITQEVPLDPAQVQPCRHIFSWEAISEWNARHAAGTTPCPNCRTPIQQITPMELRPTPRPPSRNPSFSEPRLPSRNPSFSEPRLPSRNPSFSEPRPPSRNPSFDSDGTADQSGRLSGLSNISIFNPNPAPASPLIDLVDAPAATL